MLPDDDKALLAAIAFKPSAPASQGATALRDKPDMVCGMIYKASGVLYGAIVWAIGGPAISYGPAMLPLVQRWVSIQRSEAETNGFTFCDFPTIYDEIKTGD